MDVVSKPAVEFLPWYVPGDMDMSRCARCGALVISADQETHVTWHSQNTAGH